MPNQVGTWLGTRRAKGLAPRWMDIGLDLEAISDKGPGLAGTECANTLWQSAFAAVFARRADLPDCALTGSNQQPGLRSCAKVTGACCSAQVPRRKIFVINLRRLVEVTHQISK